MSISFENVVSLLLKSGRKKFKNTTRYLGDHNLVFTKGVYPYSYMTCADKFDEIELPSIDEFHDKLNDEALDAKDYDRAKKTWTHFDMKTLRDHHDHYLLSDVLLLADIMEKFRNTIFDEYKLVCLHFYTLPSLAWTSALKHTGVKLDLITYPDVYLMIENNMRGGIATISHRHVVVNNPQVKGYESYDPI